jgi:hypothetical protein
MAKYVHPKMELRNKTDEALYSLNSRQPMNPVSPPTTTVKFRVFPSTCLIDRRQIGLRSNRSNRVEMEHFSYDAETSNEHGVKITKSVITESV